VSSNRAPLTTQLGAGWWGTQQSKYSTALQLEQGRQSAIMMELK